MKTSILFFLLTCCGALCLGQQPASTPDTTIERSAKSWQEYSSADGGFSVVFPGTPKHTTQELNGGGMQAELNMYHLKTFADYSVMYADYSFPTSNPNIAKIILDSGAQGAVESTKSTLLEIKEISLDNFPGRYLKEKMPNGEIMRVKMLLVGQRMFQVAVTTPREDGETAQNIKFYEETANKFLDSFKLLKRETAVTLAPNAPVDTPVEMTAAQIRKFEEAIKPHVQKARETYPEVKARYLKGLPEKHIFFITTRLRDKQGRFEQVFIAVTEIKEGFIKGIIASEIGIVSGYKNGDAYSFPETELLDWTISKPDGSEEGNFVGKFLETYRP